MIIERQNDRCIYCEKLFGSYVNRKGKRIKLRIEYDHFSPYVYNADNRATNIVAACHVCNRIKSDLMFKTIEEARVHILSCWQLKGYEL